MSSDSVRPIEGLIQRVQAVQKTSTRLETLRDHLARDLDLKRAEVEGLRLRIQKLTMVGELFRSLMDQLVVNQVRTVESVVTEGLNAIFHDLNLAFEANISSRYNKISVDFVFRQGAADDPLAIRGRPLDSFGGGPSAVADLILRMMTLLRLKRKPLLLLDETLGWVSDEYVDSTGQFLRQLAESMNVTLLLVTHKPSFTEHADRAYRCHEVEVSDTRHLELRSA